MASMLGLEPLLLARIRQVLPDLPETAVAGSAGWGASEKLQPPKGVLILFDGYRIKSRTAANKILTQTWLVVVSIRTAEATGNRARSEADPLLSDLLAAARPDGSGGLDGWKSTEPGYHRLELADAPRADYSPGRAWFPLAFAADVNL